MTTVKTHNQGVFDAYTPEIRAARRSGVITGLPDAYGRGRIIGDYRRVALYGVDYLIKEKQQDLLYCGNGTMSDDIIRQREELSEQIRALSELKELRKQSTGLIFLNLLKLQEKHSNGYI